jgi:putative lipoic acid-binding regulatory protein
MSDQQSALQFPCSFPIKALGKAGLELDILVVEIIRRHAPDFGEGAVTLRPSKGGKFISVTVTIQATSKKQLDAIYQDLSDCPEVMMAL